MTPLERNSVLGITPGFFSAFSYLYRFTEFQSKDKAAFAIFAGVVAF
jgi:hypothetical protein